MFIIIPDSAIMLFYAAIIGTVAIVYGTGYIINKVFGLSED